MSGLTVAIRIAIARILLERMRDVQARRVGDERPSACFWAFCTSRRRPEPLLVSAGDGIMVRHMLHACGTHFAASFGRDRTRASDAEQLRSHVRARPDHDPAD